MRDLNGRLRRKKLNFNEKETFKKIRRHFINEWLLADDSLTPKEAQQKIRKALSSGVQKERKGKQKGAEM
jgi:RNA polymerase-interacting CarD/CdnL/TRCF family regulator